MSAIDADTMMQTSELLTAEETEDFEGIDVDPMTWNGKFRSLSRFRKAALLTSVLSVVTISAVVIYSKTRIRLVDPVAPAVTGTFDVVGMSTWDQVKDIPAPFTIGNDRQCGANSCVPGDRCCPGLATWVCGGPGAECCQGEHGSTMCAPGDKCCENSGQSVYCCGAGTVCHADACGVPGAKCFPGNARVQVRGKDTVPLDALSTGEEILTRSPSGKLTYEPVLSFIHAWHGSSGEKSEFLTVTHSFGQFHASANHVIFVPGGDKLVGDLQPGETLLFASKGTHEEMVPSTVLSVGRNVSMSMYAPLTASGTLVVDGIVSSAYASYDNSNSLPHSAIHAFMFPVRAYHAAGLVCSSDSTVVVPQTPIDKVHPYIALMENSVISLAKSLKGSM